ncbi:MAG TPA: ABC transporter ATP-binding protein [Polyangiales bacterium]
MNVLSIAAPAIGYSAQIPVLRDVKLEVARGESIALLGGNGAGKTALLHFICGVLPLGGATRVVSGRAIASTQDAVAAGAGLVVQEPDDQLLGSSVRSDAEIGPNNLQLTAAEVKRRVDAALAKVGLSALADRSIETLSFGERKAASLAGMLAMAPSLLLLDEPTAGLDPLGELSFCALLRELARDGTTLLTATHAVDLVPHFANRVVLLGEGRVLADGPCGEVLTQTELLARARVRRPWPVELWSRLHDSHGSRESRGSPLTMDELTRALRAS